MDAKSFIFGVLAGSITGGACVYIFCKRGMEEQMWHEVDKQVSAGIESYKKGLDEAADSVISMEEARKMVRRVQKDLEDSEDDCASPQKSFSSLDEGNSANEDQEETENYAGIYDQYHRPMPSELFNYSDDIPKERLDNELDVEAERVVQENIERLDRFEEEMALRESPEEDADPEARSIRAKAERERSKNVQQITDEEFFTSNRDYDKETILYYKKDRVMCFENEEVIMDKEEILGPDYLKWLDVFNTTKVTSAQGKSLYLRSTFLKTDYEVILYAGSYEHFVNGPEIG